MEGPHQCIKDGDHGPQLAVIIGDNKGGVLVIDPLYTAPMSVTVPVSMLRAWLDTSAGHRCRTGPVTGNTCYLFSLKAQIAMVGSRFRCNTPACVARHTGSRETERKARFLATKSSGTDVSDTRGCVHVDRRSLFLSGTALLLTASPASALTEIGRIPDKAPTIYPDFTLDEKTGLQYKDLETGSGDKVVVDGNSVVVDWAGVTVGYYGRIFEARNKSRGGSFTGDTKDYLRLKVGDERVIPGFNQALLGMKVGGVRRVIVPASQGYPDQRNGFKGYLPAPGTFSGKRTLDFVLQNEGMMDKTLLFDIELLKIID